MDVGGSFNSAWEALFGFLPNLLGFLVLLLVGYVVARLAATATRKVLERAGLDRRLRESRANRFVEAAAPGARPSRGIARVVLWLVLASFAFAAVGVLGIPALTGFVGEVLAYLPNVVVAVAILVVAAIASGALATAASRVMGDTPTGRIVSAVVPALVLVIAMFMVLEQLRVAEEIIRIAFAATMFALALGLALAFGLGGRDLAGRVLEDAYRRGREDRERARTESTRSGYSTGSFGRRAAGSFGAGSSGNGDHAPDPSLAHDPGATQAWSSDPPQNRF